MASNNGAISAKNGYCAGIVIPAHNEAACIATCLFAVMHASALPGPIKIVVVANGCTDDTATIAHRIAPAARARGWELLVIETNQPGKLNALNLGEAVLDVPITIYLDADVIVSPTLLADLTAALDRPEPAYASGEPQIVANGSLLTQAYARFWRGLPFVQSDVPGFGVFGVNRAGRERWANFPDIIADDAFARLHFSPSERLRVAATYKWPLVGRVQDLVRVRRRQNAGVAELGQRYPELRVNDTVRKPGPMGLLRRLFRDPTGFMAYSLVLLLTRIPADAGTPRWVRGR